MSRKLFHNIEAIQENTSANDRTQRVEDRVFSRTKRCTAVLPRQWRATATTADPVPGSFILHVTC